MKKQSLHPNISNMETICGFDVTFPVYWERKVLRLTLPLVRPTVIKRNSTSPTTLPYSQESALEAGINWKNFIHLANIYWAFSTSKTLCQWLWEMTKVETETAFLHRWLPLQTGIFRENSNSSKWNAKETRHVPKLEENQKWMDLEI